MLMDILMESLMSMDDESLDYVLESCDAEELEIISDAMEARYEDGPTVVKDKSAMINRVIDNIGTNIAERRKAKQSNPEQREILEKIGRNKLYGKNPNNIRRFESTSKYEGVKNAREMRAFEDEYRGQDRFAKYLSGDSYKSNKDWLKKGFKDSSDIGNRARSDAKYYDDHGNHTDDARNVYHKMKNSK